MTAIETILIRQLRSAGASGNEIGELLEYNANPFDLRALEKPLVLPLEDEPFVDSWRRWVWESQHDGAATTLCRHLAELRFPICEGVSQWPSYRQATRRGFDPARLSEATGLPLRAPESISLEVEASVAGSVPVIVVRDRQTFVTLVRALGRNNEPVPVPDALGGLMITGYRNWSRLRTMHGTSAAALCVAGHHESGRDRFMLLSDGPYSAVRAADLHLEDDVWRRLSLDLRRAHEQVHYLMRRLLGAMRNNLFDELIADYLGMRIAWGMFRADWFLRFLGLESDHYRQGGRLDIYRGEPPLSSGAFQALQNLVRLAIRNLEEFDHALGAEAWSPERLVAVLGALTSHRLETLAAEGSAAPLRAAFERFESKLDPNAEPTLLAVRSMS